MDIFTTHPVLLWVTVIAVGAIALSFLLPLLFWMCSLLFVGVIAFFGTIFALFTALHDEKWGLWAVIITIVLIVVAILCFIF